MPKPKAVEMSDRALISAVLLSNSKILDWENEPTKRKKLIENAACFAGEILSECADWDDNNENEEEKNAT